MDSPTLLASRRPDTRRPGAPAPDRVPAATVDPFQLAYWIVGAVGAALAFVLIRFTVDDAFISWRYGASLMHGFWNWNASSDYKVEAYSNPLIAAAAAVPALVGLPAELFFKLVGLGILGAYLRVVHRLAVPRLQKLLLTACVLLNPLFFVHLFAGLETASFALLLAALFGLLYTRGRLGRLGHAVAVAVVLTRPEGMLFAVVAEVWAAHLNRRRADVLAAVGVIAFEIVYWLTRAAYFGSFMPNPFHVKSGSRLSDPAAIQRALTGTIGLVVAVVTLFVAAEAVRRLLLKRRHPGSGSGPVSPWRDATPALMAAVSALIVFGLYSVSDLQMDFGNRFRWQLLFPVALVLLSRPWFAERGTAAEAAETAEAAVASVATDPLDPPSEAPGTAAPATTPSARWSALALFICAVTAIGGAADYQASPGIAVTAAVIAGLAAGVVYVTGHRVAFVVAAAAIAASVSTFTFASIVDWAAYRYHLAAAHEAIGRAIADDRALTGVVAVEDAGILPDELRADQWALDLSGPADPFYGRAVPPAVTSKLVAVVAGAGQPYDEGPWWGDSSSGAVFAQSQAQKFHLAGTVLYAPNYWLRVYVKPGLENQLPKQLWNAELTASTQNVQSSGTLLMHHLLDMPFLHF
jgi:hypothetical protein